MVLKLRAWDKNNQRWMTPEIEDSEESEIRLDLWGNVTFRLPWWEQVIDGIYTVDGSDMFDIMQSTHLKDKNGVEIFEGDVLQITSFKRNSSIKGEVIFNAGAFCLKCRLYGKEYRVHLVGTQEHPSNFDTEEFEVIGNIYESPELMEVAE